MTEEMISRAHENAQETGTRERRISPAEIESLPLDDGSSDCVISNCVVNPVPDKSKAFAEMFRVLKPGGRLAIAHLALKQELPLELAGDVGAYVGCIAGAMLIDDYEIALTAAGFDAVQIVDSGRSLNACAKLAETSSCGDPPDCCGSASVRTGIHEGLAERLDRFDINQYAASVRVFALKPKTSWQGSWP